MEVLSPASNMEHIKVAIDSKSNAVYGGVKKWNARNKAINFSDEEYNFLIEELHKNGIKFYLTLNILMLDEEIKEVINFLKTNKLPDAFIVTDIGLIRELKKNFPDVPLHFSTQFGAHNINDVNYIESLGGERAILARELTLDEVKKIKSNTDIELECFIWGSQCLSFSGLCFFGTLINGGGGNRGKCIITCRDIYSVNGQNGHHLYVPDMDCINLISKLGDIDCLKLEGRRRKPSEIKKILEQIKSKESSKRNVGYLYGKNITNNNLYEKINTRTKYTLDASELKDTSDEDICIEYSDDIPTNFSTDYNNPNVKYIYTEKKKKYDLNKKNISLDFILDNNNLIKEILYVNYRGDGHSFYEKNTNDDIIELNTEKFIQEIESNNNNINLYKIKYTRNVEPNIFISRNLYDELKQYILNDCKAEKIEIKKSNIKIDHIYLETRDIDVIRNFVDDEFIKVIYNISSVSDLKNISSIVKEFGNSVIYKLPIFNWESCDLLPYLKELENNEVMFTRYSQIYLCKGLSFSKKYIDYTIYVWNKQALMYLLENGIDEFTASPELSYDRNKTIFDNQNFQVILGGKLPLVYTRNCFSHLFNCGDCRKSQACKKEIKNIDKQLLFEIYCNDDYRYVLNSDPILNDFSKVNLSSNTKFRLVADGQSIEDIKFTIECLKNKNYYNNLKKNKYWKNSYECNLLEGKE